MGLPFALGYQTTTAVHSLAILTTMISPATVSSRWCFARRQPHAQIRSAEERGQWLTSRDSSHPMHPARKIRCADRHNGESGAGRRTSGEAPMLRFWSSA